MEAGPGVLGGWIDEAGRQSTAERQLCATGGKKCKQGFKDSRRSSLPKVGVQ